MDVLILRRGGSLGRLIDQSTQPPTELFSVVDEDAMNILYTVLTIALLIASGTHPKEHAAVLYRSATQIQQEVPPEDPVPADPCEDVNCDELAGELDQLNDELDALVDAGEVLADERADLVEERTLALRIYGEAASAELAGRNEVLLAEADVASAQAALDACELLPQADCTPEQTELANAQAALTTAEATLADLTAELTAASDDLDDVRDRITSKDLEIKANTRAQKQKRDEIAPKQELFDLCCGDDDDGDGDGGGGEQG